MVELSRGRRDRKRQFVAVTEPYGGKADQLIK